jgi:hypothetical protein
MAETSLGVLKREGEIRGSSGHDPGAADFDEHVRFYKSALRVAPIFIGHVVAKRRFAARSCYSAKSAGSSFGF